MQIVTTAGLGHAAIRARVASGELQRVRRGAYLRSADQQPVAEAQHQALIQAVLGDRRDAVLSHISATVIRNENTREERLRRASGRWLVRVTSHELGDLPLLRRTVLDAAGYASRHAG